jgi:hypothetical protein
LKNQPRPKKDDAADQQRGADQRRRFEQHFLDEPMGHDADHGGRQEGEQDAEDEAAAVLVARQGRRDLPQPRGIDRQDGQDGAKLDQHLKRLAGAFEAQEMPQEKNVPCGRNGDEFRQPFHDPEDQCVEKRLSVHNRLSLRINR